MEASDEVFARGYAYAVCTRENHAVTGTTGHRCTIPLVRKSLWVYYVGRSCQKNGTLDGSFNPVEKCSIIRKSTARTV